MSTGTAILSAALVLTLAQIEAGNRAYRRGGVDEAVAAYRRAVEKDPESAAARYNLGTAYLEDGRVQSALPHLSRATEAAPPELRARAFYNLGTAHLQRAMTGDRPSALESVDALRRALLLEPEDADAKWNLELALRQLEAMPPQPQQGASSEEQNETDASPDDSGAGQASSGSASPETGPRAPRTQPLEPLPRATAEQILNAIEEQERALQREKLRQQRSTGRPAGPDW